MANIRKKIKSMENMEKMLRDIINMEVLKVN